MDKTMKRHARLTKYHATLLTAFMAAPAFAGLFSTSLSAEDIHQIKRLAVVSIMDDTVHGRMQGLMVFQNKSFDAPVPGWNLDAAVTKDLVQHIAVGAKISGEVTSLTASSTKQKEIIGEARKQGFDALLVVLPEENVHDRSLGSGVTLWRRKIPGVDKVYPCAVVAIRVFRTADGKQIGFTTPDPCVKPEALVWHDSWTEFSDEERQATLAALQAFAEQQLRSALVSLKLTEK
jgi:hypothetical protein